MGRMGSRMRLRREVLSLLNSLGENSAQVGGALAEAGACGEVASLANCPVANYLHPILTADERVISVRVSSEQVVIKAPQSRLALHIRIPSSVRDFIRAFDRGQFQGLQGDARVNPEERSSF